MWKVAALAAIISSSSLAIASGSSLAAPAATRWVQRSTPVLRPTQAWEGPGVQEPDVIYENGLYRMWYTGGWTNCAIGYATSRDGIHWRKPLDHPVIGLGHGGAKGQACHVSILHYDGILYAYWADANPPVDAGLHVSTSFDGIHWWTSPWPILVSSPDDWSDSLFGNTTVWREGQHQWKMMYEDWNGRAALWETGLAEGSSPFDWHKVGSPLMSLQVVAGGMFGGAQIMRHRHGYTVYYHAAEDLARGGNRDTSIYSSTSKNLTDWTRPRLVERLGSRPWQVDQVADPFVVQTRHGVLLYSSGVNNLTGREEIGLAFRVARGR